MSRFEELGDGIFRRHYESLDINIGVVIGADAMLLVDSRESHRHADELRDDLRSLTKLPVGWVVNTHYHWDHTWGNARFPEAELWGHNKCRDEMLESSEDERQRVLDWAPPKHHRDYREVVITPPTNTFSQTTAIDLGDHKVHLDYYGLGHTNSDIVVRVEDVMFAGDLIEDGAPPSFGDSFPLSWQPTLEAIDFPGVVVPGHGGVVDREFVTTQAAEIAAVARLATVGHRDGAAVDSLVDGGPYPPHTMQVALARAYAQLNAEI